MLAQVSLIQTTTRTTMSGAGVSHKVKKGPGKVKRQLWWRQAEPSRDMRLEGSSKSSVTISKLGIIVLVISRSNLFRLIIRNIFSKKHKQQVLRERDWVLYCFADLPKLPKKVFRQPKTMRNKGAGLFYFFVFHSFQTSPFALLIPELENEWK